MKTAGLKPPTDHALTDWLKQRAISKEAAYRLVFINGIYAAEHSNSSDLPPGVRLECKNGFSLDIPDKATLDRTIHVLSLTTSGDVGASFEFETRFSITAGASARLKIIFEEKGLRDTEYSSHFSMKLGLKQGACVSLCHVQEPGPKAKSFLTHDIALGQHSSFDALHFTVGGALTENQTKAVFNETHGFCSLKGVALLDGQSEIHQRLAVHHQTPSNISRQHFKNILTGQSKAEFDSLVFVHPLASQSDSRQLNRNLLLSDQAQGRSRPQLQIENDDVACTHGATTGPLDEGEIFYLRSRGLSADTARFVLTQGFAQELIAEVQDPDLKKYLGELIETKLKAAARTERV